MEHCIPIFKSDWNRISIPIRILNSLSIISFDYDLLASRVNIGSNFWIRCRFWIVIFDLHFAPRFDLDFRFRCKWGSGGNIFSLKINAKYFLNLETLPENLRKLLSRTDTWPVRENNFLKFSGTAFFEKVKTKQSGSNVFPKFTEMVLGSKLKSRSD